MSDVTTNQPLGTPTWIDLGIPDLDKAMSFYGGVFGWEFDVGGEEMGRYTMCRLRGKAVAAMMPNPDPTATEFWWNVYLASDDLDATVARARDAGGEVLVDPMDVMNQGRMAILKDPSGGQFGVWQGRDHVGCQLVNEPGALLRNDLVTPNPGPARDFYASVFDFTLDGNDDLDAGVDFTFLRRPDGHEIGGIMGVPEAPASSWGTLFQVENADAAVAAAREHGGTASDAEDMQYGRMAQVTDPFGAQFTVGSTR
ncbi:MAG: VOC family protein [Rhodococcus sp.]|nr:VOC family protein [Rhodococcus sp. (in: high G+C Gram-positive bacteria)]